ncbi:MAG TPA: tetratricopeptide repeat protein [Candidatus Cybelea sp.]|nr:tetratricopeptide repeat protein [Candidatus Cybelea sp.]
MNFLAVVFVAASAAAPVHLATATANPQAQVSIDRGLFLYYAYDGTDAKRAFAQAAALDSQLAAAYWGIALAEGPDLNTPLTEERFKRAAYAAHKAAALEPNTPPFERRLVEIMATRYAGTFADWPADDAAYRRAMLTFAQSSRDENAELLAAEALLEHGGLLWQNGQLASEESRTALSLVVGLLRSDQDNVMANHLCIHLYDLAPDRAPALPCAKRLDGDSFPPEAEHLAHMPAHYWIETGNYAAAMRSSERAYDLMAQLAATDPTSQHVEQYDKHDVAVGYSAAMMQGNFATAMLWSKRMSSAFETNFEGVTALRFGRYEAAYASDGAEFDGASVRGLAAVRLGHLAEARALAAKVPATNSALGYIPQIFFARLAAAGGDFTQMQRWIDKSLANQHDSFGGELIPLIPAGEALGAIRLERNDIAGAIAAFGDALAAYPNDPRALFGLSRAYAANGDQARAATTRASFEKAWEGADTKVEDALP